MGIAGIRWDVTDDEIIDVIKNSNGIVRSIASHLNVSYQSIYNRLNQNPEMQKALADARKAFVERKKDGAELVLDDMFDQYSNNPEYWAGHAFRSAQFVLNNLGRDRGYAHPDVLASEDGPRAAASAIIALATQLAQQQSKTEQTVIKITDD